MLQNAFQDEACAELFSDARLLGAMARFEAALADACAKAGILSMAEAKVIDQVCAGAKFDTAGLARNARRAGTLAIPFINSLTAQVAAVSPGAARWVHFGATSGDLIDTAVVLCLRESSAGIIALSRRAGDAAAALAKAHGGMPTVARTLLQPAVPVPFGWKAVVWLSLVGSCHAAFTRAARESQLLQFGGAGGTLAACGAKGEAIAAALATALGLQAPVITWHSARAALRGSVPKPRSSQAPQARSPATCHSSCNPRSAKPSSPKARPRVDPQPCRTNEILWAASPPSKRPNASPGSQRH